MQLTAEQTVVLVCEKKSQYDLTLAAFQSEFPQVRFLGVLTQSGSPHTFRQKLPRDMPISAVPQIAEPQWNVTNQAVYLDHVLQEGMDARELLRRADAVICATDPDREGAHAFRNLTRHYLDDPDDRLVFPVILPVALDKASIIDEIRAGRTTADADYWRVVARGDAKRFFDYNWAINAIPLFSPILAHVGVPQGKRWMSKYALQLLFELEQRGQAMAEGDIIKLMMVWTGTGKHMPNSRGLGSPVSRGAIVEQLIDMGLLEVPEAVEKTQHYRVSGAGRRFLELLHPRCRDVDLPFRISNWEKDWPASRPSMETYIRTFFGRQRRFDRPAKM